MQIEDNDRVAPQIVNAHIDERNKALYMQISSIVSIRCVVSPDNLYGAIATKEDGAFILIPRGQTSSAYFTHELLHIQLFINGLDINNELHNIIHSEHYGFSKIKPNNLFANIFSVIGNKLEHIKMFESFLSLGYSSNEFLCDFNTRNVTKEQIREELNSKYVLGTKDCYNGYIILRLVNIYVYSVCSLNPQFDYTEEIEYMKCEEPDLCLLLDSLIEMWKMGRCDKQKVAIDFCEKFDKWLLDKKAVV